MVTPSAESAEGSRPILLDAYCLLNLYASRQIAAILGDSSARFAITARVVAESGYVRRGGSDDDADERDPLDLAPRLAAGSLTVWRIATDAEAASFIDFAAALDDGEAETCALAHHRGAIVATDDRKARRLCGQHVPPLELRSTLDIIRDWAKVSAIAPAILGELLRDIRDRARFSPNRNDPLRPWWDDTIVR